MDRETALRKRQGTRLKAARKAAGYRSARAAAKENNWPESSVRAHEGGSRTIGLDDAERYARRYRANGAKITAKAILFEGEERTAAFAATAAEALNVPVLSWVAAGEIADVGEVPHPADAPTIAIAELPPGDWLALRVDGDSMDKVAPDGSIIAINRRDRRLISGKYYVFADRGAATFKKYIDKPTRLLMPFSTNASHLPIVPGKNIMVIGRVRRVVVEL